MGLMLLIRLHKYVYAESVFRDILIIIFVRFTLNESTLSLSPHIFVAKKMKRTNNKAMLR